MHPVLLFVNFLLKINTIYTCFYPILSNLLIFLLSSFLNKTSLICKSYFLINNKSYKLLYINLVRFVLCNYIFIQLWVVCTISKTIDFSIIFKIISTSFLSNFYIFLNKNIANGGVFFTPKLTIFYLIFYLFFSH